MEESLIIDFRLLNEVGISANDLLYLYNKYVKESIFDVVLLPSEIKELENKRLLKIDTSTLDNIDIKVVLRERANQLLKLLLVNTDNKISNTKNIKKSNRVIDEVIDNRISEFRNKWKGKKAGSMGSAKSCKQKLKRWMKENPEYSFDEILKAADLYLQKEGKDTRFLQRADYFIFKMNLHKEEESRLSAYIDEIDEYVEEDWTSNLN